METRGYVRVCLFLAACLSVLACTGMFRNYGRFNPSDAVSQTFENYQINPDFRYYVSGPHVYPNAIMGLSRSYRLDPDTLWREATPAQIKVMVQDRLSKSVSSSHRGFEILDNHDRQIGVWYSSLETSRSTFVRMQEDGSVRIDTPALQMPYRHPGSRMLMPLE